MYFENRAFKEYFTYYLNKFLNDKQIICYSGIEDYLYKKLFDISVRTLVTEMYELKNNDELQGEDTFERYNYYESKFLDENFFSHFIEKYPVLDENIKKIIVNAEKYINEIINEFEKDKAILQEKFDKDINTIEKIEIGEGDTHNNGKSVAIITTNSSKIVYKPHALVGDELLESIVKWIEEKDNAYKLKTLRYYSADDYGWQEYIEYSGLMSKKEAKEYYKKCGIFLGIFYILGTTDIHFENVIVNNGNPYFIDLETITSAPKALEFSSVLETAYIPRIMANDMNVYDFDISGLCATGNVKSKIRTIDVVDKFTDRMRVENVEITVEAQNNTIQIDGEAAKIEDFCQDVIDGFCLIWDIISQNKKEYNELVNQILSKARYCGRVVLRSTQIYQKFLVALTHPDYLRSYEARAMILRKLIIGENTTEINRMRDEIRQLENLDVPYYYINFQEKDIFSGDNAWQEEYNKFTPSDGIQYRINHLDEKNKQVQIDIIHKSLFTAYANKEESKYELLTAKKIGIDYPQIIAERLMSHVIENETSLTMIINTVIDGNYGVNTLNLDIPEGGGIIWFLYNFGKYYNKVKYCKTAVDLLKYGVLCYRYLAKNNYLSAFRGDGAILYLSYNMWIATKDDDIYKIYDRYLEQILKKIAGIKENEWKNIPVDYYNGLAGLVILFCNLYTETKDERLIYSLNKVVEKMVDNLEIKEKIGLFEGLSGVVYAIAKYDSLFINKKYGALCIELLKEEYQLFDKREKKLGIGTGLIGILFVAEYINGEYKQSDIYEVLEDIYKYIENIQIPYENNIMNGITGIKELVNKIEIENEYKQKINGIQEYEAFGLTNNYLIESFMLGSTGVAYNQLKNNIKALPSVTLLEVCR